MKKQLSCALITIGLIGLNVVPAKAVNGVLATSQVKTTASGEWCVWFPWVGELCWDL